tara:strand:+ start:86 stop:547 length:462 start_codon:yes stop_codon:yes gene_type:complete
MNNLSNLYSININPPPLKLKDNYNFDKYHNINSCNVSVIWCIYDKHKKRITSIGESRPCGINHYQSSIHAEEKAIKEFRFNTNKNKNSEIYVWRWSKTGDIKTKYCCNRCTKLIIKYKFQDKIFTFNNYKKCPAIIDNPQIPLSRHINKKNQI